MDGSFFLSEGRNSPRSKSCHGLAMFSGFRRRHKLREESIWEFAGSTRGKLAQFFEGERFKPLHEPTIYLGRQSRDSLGVKQVVWR